MFVTILRSQIASAAVGAAKLLLTCLLGAVLVLASCGVTASTTGFMAVMSVDDSVATQQAAAQQAQQTGSGFDTTIPDIQLSGGFVSDIDRYRLILTCWSGQNAVIALAVSIAEDHDGNPAARNVNKSGPLAGSVDLGLFQINSGLPVGILWAQYGGEQALEDPQTNTNAACSMYRGRGFEPWSTYNDGSYLKFMARAQAAADGAVTIASPTTTDVFPLPGWTGAVNLHWGIASGGSDLFAPQGWPIVSVSAGTVLEAGWDNVGGNSVLIRGNDGLQYYYAHFTDSPAVHVGQQVIPGILLGHVGNTGDADKGPTHLHIGIGHTILLGADAYGGTGSGFDAVSFLRTLYAQMHQGG